MNEHGLVLVPAPERSQQTEKPPLWKAIQVGRTLYRMVPNADAPNGFEWHVQRGLNSFAEPDWKPSQCPATKDVLAALYEAS